MHRCGGFPCGQGSGADTILTASPLIRAAGRVTGAMAPTAPEITPPVDPLMIPRRHPSAWAAAAGAYSSYSLGGAGGGAIQLDCTARCRWTGMFPPMAAMVPVSGGGGGAGGQHLALYRYAIRRGLHHGRMAAAGRMPLAAGAVVDGFPSATQRIHFNGLISAYGGGGAGWGGAANKYLKTNSQSYGQLTLDNGGNTEPTPRSASVPSTCLVTGGAIGQGPLGSWTVRNLQIGTNGVLTTIASLLASNCQRDRQRHHRCRWCHLG